MTAGKRGTKRGSDVLQLGRMTAAPGYQPIDVRRESTMTSITDDDLGPFKIEEVYEPSINLRGTLVVDNVARDVRH